MTRRKKQPKDVNPIVPQGFYSYRQLDDKIARKYLTALRVNLEEAVYSLTGTKITIWQDVDQLEWGHHWKQGIENGLADAAFFIPVISPLYLRSQYCRDEFARFAAFERKRKRNDLILPLVYVMPDELEDEGAKIDDPVVKLILERQYVNWDKLRLIGEERTEYRVGLDLLARRIKALLKSFMPEVARSQAKARAPKRGKKTKGRTASSTSVPSGVARGSTSRFSSQQVIRVNRMGGPGVFTTINEGLAAAKGGDLVTVAQGLYREKITLDKPVALVGEGNLGDVTIEMKGVNVVESAATFGRLKNITIRQAGDGKWFGVRVAGGSLEIDSCDVTSAGISCVGVVSGAELRIRNCRLHGSPQAGVAFFSKTQGTVENCDIFGNGLGGIEVLETVDVTIRGNRIHDGRGSGIYFRKAAGGLVEDNQIFGNASAGISIRDGATPTIRQNRIYEGKQSGIFVTKGGAGVIDQNEIFGNKLSGIEIGDNANPTVSDNDIQSNSTNGIMVHGNTGAVIEDNRIRRNTFTGVWIRPTGIAQVRNNKIADNEHFGIHHEATGGTFEGNELSGNKRGAKHLSPEAEANGVWKANEER